MLLTYSSGEQFQSGDRVLYHGGPGRIEFVARIEDPSTRWSIKQYGGGCMILAPSFGHVFITETDEDLEFVGRGTE